ncbi:pH-sensitive adenylate cyclase [Agromyces sp. NDB4Y10]|uniref:adenylate/guanylate cyclase domain-containing protein n=1 Tax=Agromyces sp. NDB4Y10 TaxID=1775951 RepID=UPI0007B2FA21|nr:adenylate/guanylate cyclase domain-containing protein [Agromyces sp. NDB4Y10]KZE95196.1 pH-sensitive adenylate cyclase [Agromyces sp. NDB4Y10]
MDGTGGRYPLDELVSRSGVDRAFVERLVALGLVTPDPDDRFGGGDVQRVRLIEACDRAGIGVEVVAAAAASGHLSLDFLDGPQYRWSELCEETFDELAERLEIPFDVIQRIGAVLVNRHVSPEDRTRADDDALYTPTGMVAAWADLDAVMRIGRVYVDALRRVADAEAELFQTHLVGGLMQTGLTYGEALERSTWLAARMTPHMDRMLLAVYHRQQERGWTEGIIEGIERAVEASGAHAGPARPPAFAFIDLAGYTAITDQQGDAEAARLARELSSMVDRIVADHAGTPVKWLGDGVMVHFRDPGDAVRATVQMVAAAPVIGLPAHAGIAAGPVVTQDGDYFGRAVNLASRISGAAAAGQTLVTGSVVDLADDPSLAFREVGPIELKGFADRVPVFEAAPVG